MGSVPKKHVEPVSDPETDQQPCHQLGHHAPALLGKAVVFLLGRFRRLPLFRGFDPIVERFEPRVAVLGHGTPGVERGGS